MTCRRNYRSESLAARPASGREQAGATLRAMSTCGACGRPIAEPETTPIAVRLPCPACGSTSRHLERTVEVRLTMRSSLAIKLVRGATGRVAQEQFAGADKTIADGTWTDKSLVRDYEQDRYVEKVVREHDGAILRDVAEPLSAHRGRGSDRPDRRVAREAAKAASHAACVARKAQRDAEWQSRR